MSSPRHALNFNKQVDSCKSAFEALELPNSRGRVCVLAERLISSGFFNRAAARFSFHLFHGAPSFMVETFSTEEIATTM